jgi:hypothetical protein
MIYAYFMACGKLVLLCVFESRSPVCSNFHFMPALILYFDQNFCFHFISFNMKSQLGFDRFSLFFLHVRIYPAWISDAG